MRGVLLLLVSLICGAHAHPVSTFVMEIVNATGYPSRGNFATNTNVSLYFHFQDQLHDYGPVYFKDLMLYHKRFFHVLLVSEDQEIALHTHPDDFMDMATLDGNTTVFHVNLSFPRGGEYSVAASFMMMDMDLGITREGFCQTTVDINGTSGLNPNPTFNLTTTNRFTTYPIGADEVFNEWVDIKTNQDNNGYWVTFNIIGSTAYNPPDPTAANATENYVPARSCTWMILSVYTNDPTMDTYATMIPFLASSVHFTVAANDGGVYHAHGMYLLNGSDPVMVQDMMNGMTMEMMMSIPQTDPTYNYSMNARMIGVTENGTLNCLNDAGTVMDEMQGMMDMSLYYGPPTFTVVAGLLDFPLLGDWRIFAYMKMSVNGEDRLIVPHFAVRAYNPTSDVPTPPVTPALTTDQISDVPSKVSDASTISTSSILLLIALFATLI